MKIEISFLDEERGMVTKIVTAVKQILDNSRTHAPKQPKGERFQIYITSAKR